MFASSPLDPDLDLRCLQSFYLGVSPAFQRAGTKHGRVDSWHTAVVLSTAPCDRMTALDSADEKPCWGEEEDELESAALRDVPASNEEVGTANKHAGTCDAPCLLGITDLLTFFSGDVVRCKHLAFF